LLVVIGIVIGMLIFKFSAEPSRNMTLNWTKSGQFREIPFNRTLWEDFVVENPDAND